jgi:hypothetical protein
VGFAFLGFRQFFSRSQSSTPSLPAPEGVKKSNDLGSPRPNEGEGLGGEGGGSCRIEARRAVEEALQRRKDKCTLPRYGNPPHPPAPLPRWARGAEIERDVNFFTPSLSMRERVAKGRVRGLPDSRYPLVCNFVSNFRRLRPFFCESP